jgi:CheY-like chemotaxis protein
MADRSVLCIEPDSDTVGEIRTALEPYGFGVENIPTGEEALEWGRTNTPALIILSVEPRKVGYAICNKLKRSPTLRDVPLILISSEETQATFDQHRKLKSRADEYLLKPLAMPDLLSRVDKLVGLGERVEEIDADDDDILIADEDISDEQTLGSGHEADRLQEGGQGENGASQRDRGQAAEAPGERGQAIPQQRLMGDTSEQQMSPSELGDDLSSGLGGGLPFEGERFDRETQAAFAALEAGGSEGAAAGGAGGDMVDLRSLWAEDDAPPSLGWEQQSKAAKDDSELERARSSATHPESYRTGETLGPELLTGETTPPPTSGQRQRHDSLLGEGELEVGLDDELDNALREGLDIPPAPDDVQYHESDNESGRAYLGGAAPPRDDARVAELQARAAELQARIESLETERQTHRQELEEARERYGQSAAFSKEREFLGLREIINKKEKDILDLRDDLDAKERQVLDHKDKVRELERARRDLEEKTLGFERSLVAAQEKVAELVQDREKSVEREKGLKFRLDDAHEEIRKSRDEVEMLRKRLSHDEGRLRAEMERLRNDLEGRIVEIEEAHRQELAQLNDERVGAEAAAENERQAELARLEGAHRAEVEGLQRRLVEEQAAANDRLQSELIKVRREHEKALMAAKEEQSAQLASERQAYEALTEAKERDHRNEILGMRRRHEEELSAAEERRQRDITEQESRRVSELEQAEQRRRAELQARDEEQHARVTEIERRHLTEKTELSERHRADYDQALGRAARAEGELAARIQEIEQAYRRLAGFEADLDAARAELGDREVRISQSRDRIAELEAKVADYEDQIVRAFQRIRTDEKTTEKARRALAVALALIDERANTSGAAAAGGMKSISEDVDVKDFKT